MFKRFCWGFLAMAGIGTCTWLALSRGGPTENTTGAVSHQEPSADRSATRNFDLPGAEPNQEIARESSRHSTGEVEKYQAEERRLAHLKEAVRDQEEKVEEKRKVLATIVRTMGIIYKGPDADYSAKPETPEEANKKALDAQAYVDAKREFETDQKLLQEMKLKLINEQLQTK